MKPLPCPCCGNEKLYLGHLAAKGAIPEMGVRCSSVFGGCGLTLSRPYSDMRGKRVVLDDMEQMLLKAAVDAWNLRVKSV